jgi:hypothetical protein
VSHIHAPTIFIIVGPISGASFPVLISIINTPIGLSQVKRQWDIDTGHWIWFRCLDHDRVNMAMLWGAVTEYWLGGQLRILVPWGHGAQGLWEVDEESCR